MNGQASELPFTGMLAFIRSQSKDLRYALYLTNGVCIGLHLPWSPALDHLVSVKDAMLDLVLSILIPAAGASNLSTSRVRVHRRC